MADISACSHLARLARRDRGAVPSSHGCEECLATGGVWAHLRLCLECGHVGCCDDSPSRHATQHYHRTRHPAIRSYEPWELWAYCYADDAFVEEFPAFESEMARRHYGPPSGVAPTPI